MQSEMTSKRNCIFCVGSVSQEWGKKAEEAKRQYEKAMKEYKASGGGASADIK